MPETEKLVERIDGASAPEIAAAVGADEEIQILVSTDLDVGGRYRAHWLAVTSKQVVVGHNGDLSQLNRVPLGDIRSASTEPLVGGGRLAIERFSGPTLEVPYSSTEAEKVSEVARGIEQLRTAEALSSGTVSSTLSP